MLKALAPASVRIIRVSESSDAWHISAQGQLAALDLSHWRLDLNILESLKSPDRLVWSLSGLFVRKSGKSKAWSLIGLRYDTYDRLRFRTLDRHDGTTARRHDPITTISLRSLRPRCHPDWIMLQLALLHVGDGDGQLCLDSFQNHYSDIKYH